MVRQLLAKAVCLSAVEAEKAAHPFLKPSLLTTQNLKLFSRFSLHAHANWRPSTLNYRLIVGKNEHHPDFLHFSTLDSSTTPAEKIWASSAKCLISPSSPPSNPILCLETQVSTGLYTTMPSPAELVHGCSSEGGRLSGLIQRKADRRKHSRQRLNFYSNSRYLTKMRGRQIKTGLPFPQSGALKIIKGGRGGLISVRAPRDAANPFLWYSYFPYKEQWAGSHGGSEWSTVFSLEQTALQCIC